MAKAPRASISSAFTFASASHDDGAASRTCTTTRGSPLAVTRLSGTVRYQHCDLAMNDLGERLEGEPYEPSGRGRAGHERNTTTAVHTEATQEAERPVRYPPTVVLIAHRPGHYPTRRAFAVQPVPFN